MALYNTTTKQEFNDKVVASEKVVLVDFWAAWCAPCRAMAPILDTVSKSMNESVDIVKVDIEDGSDNGQLAVEHGVQSIPNMLVFKNGKVVDQLIGTRPQSVLESELKVHL